MFQRKSLVAMILLPLVVGLAGLVRVTNRPDFAIRTVDVVQLTGSGMCFGVVLCAIVVLLRAPR
jgi:hypothetical protein